MKNLYFSLFLLVFISCKKGDDFKPDEPNVGAGAQTLLNVAYGGDNLQKMDNHLPANRTTATTRVIVLIHGGAWAEGDKSDSLFAPIVDSLKRRYPDWAIFNLNYRLAKYKFPFSVDNRFPVQEEDVKSAIKYIYDRRSTFGISDKWVYAGASAGGHLALLQGYKNNTPIKPKAIVDFFGPTDMVALYDFYKTSPDGDTWSATAVQALMSGTPTGNPQMYYNSSPINYVTSQSPPTIILQGGLDDVVPKEQSYSLEAKLTSVGVVNKLVYYYNQTHGWSDPVVVTDGFNQMQAFLLANVP